MMDTGRPVKARGFREFRGPIAPKGCRTAPCSFTTRSAADKHNTTRALGLSYGVDGKAVHDGVRGCASIQVVKDAQARALKHPWVSHQRARAKGWTLAREAAWKSDPALPRLPLKLCPRFLLLLPCCVSCDPAVREPSIHYIKNLANG